MKRLSYLVLIALVMIGISCKKETQTEMPREGAVNFITGDVVLVTDGKEAKARVGDAVKKGTTIKTGAKSLVDIYFGENAIKILEKSVVRVDQLITNISSNAESTELYVEKGKLFSRVAHKLAKGESYRIKTPTTIAAVRGTNFMVSEEENKGNVACLDGQVEVLNKSLAGLEGDAVPDEKSAENLKDGASVVLKEGEECVIEKDRPLTVQDLSESNRKMMQDILLNIKEIQADIRKKFEEERDRIVKAVAEQKEKDAEMVKAQIEKDKQNVKDQTDKDKDNINKILGDTDVKGVAGSADGEKSKAGDALKQEQDKQKDIFKGILPDTKQQQ